MAELNFNVADFHPLQPMDAELEYERRTDPRYAHLYTYKSSAHQAEQPPVVSEYAAWVELCKAMDREVEEAKQAWRQSLADRDAEFARLRVHCEELRTAYKKLELRAKPPQPRSTRKGA